jgi:2-amino-4-hydroxy-6-hydroxymethyldihydropteridine diphosphokinase
LKAALKIAYLGLGSNLGDRAQNLRDAISRLAGDDLRILRESSVYETEPRDLAKQPWFLNQVIEIETDLFPRRLLARVLKIERDMGRKRVIAKGPRLIDIDILLYGAAIVSAAGLEIPHARMWERRFVLEPLAELAHELCDPRTKKTIREMLKAVANQVVRKTSSKI